MEQIQTISTLKGRAILNNIYKDLKFNKQRSSYAILLSTWKLCTSDPNLGNYGINDIKVLHKLGLFKGTILWLEEIVNRFFFATVNSFVYFGAAILLLLIGVRRFTDYINDTVIIGGLLFESSLLCFMFIIMFFTPHEMDDKDILQSDNSENDNELLTEIGEISRDFADACVKLDEINNSFGVLAENQRELINQVSFLVKQITELNHPNPEMINILNDTNDTLKDFKNNIAELSNYSKSYNKERIELAVRTELERVLRNNIEHNEHS